MSNARNKERHKANMAGNFIGLNWDPKLKANMVPEEVHKSNSIYTQSNFTIYNG